MENELKELKVIIKEVKTKDGKTFKAFKAVNESGALVDLRFRKDVDTRELEKCGKAVIVVDRFSDASARYEFPRYYAGNIVSIDKIY